MAANFNFPKFKCTFLGDARVGKSSVLCRNVYNSFDEEYTGTVGIDFLTFCSSTTNTDTAQTARIQARDTGGHEKFASILTDYLKSSDSYVIVFDITCRESFTKAKHFVRQIHQFASRSSIVFLVGNKLDLKDAREVSSDEAACVAGDINAFFMEVSAKTGENVPKLFQRMTEELLASTRTEPAPAEKWTEVPLKDEAAGKSVPQVTEAEPCCSASVYAVLSQIKSYLSFFQSKPETAPQNPHGM